MNPTLDQRCLAIALRLLGRRDHSTWELIGKLKVRGFALPAIKPVIDECRRLNYIDDQRYAQTCARQLKSRGYGPLRIEQMLKSKGVPEALITATREIELVQGEQLALCRRVLTKKLKALLRRSPVADRKEQLYRFLLGRGFSPGIVQQVLNTEPLETSEVPDGDYPRTPNH